MIGDIILWIKEKYNQMFCIHDYKYIGFKFLDNPDLYECKKCRRVKL